MTVDETSNQKSDAQSPAQSIEEKMKVALDKSDFNEWYSNVVELSNLTDKRYPIKGMNVWTPYGWQVMRLIDELIRGEMIESDHDEVCFPLLISEEQFAKESEHIKGFDKEVYWVTHAGGEELDVKLLLRPTSETAMYPIFALWVRAHSDLPLKTFQLVNTFRYDTKQTRAFIRVREIHFFEAHTCHVDFEDAERQIAQDLEIMESLAKKLCLAYLQLKRPEWDKFPGAFYSIAADAYLPSGKTLQIGTIHQYKDNFSKPYEIKYEAAGGDHKYVHQTTYGMSERLIGSLIGMHGDNKGVILPPSVAPYQVVLVPILAKKSREEVLASCDELLKELKVAGIRSHFDDRDIRPGSKFYDWELRGVPLRLELGPRDLENNQLVAVRRDTGEKVTLSRSEAISNISSLLDDISDGLLANSEKLLNDSIINVDNIYDVSEPKGIVRVGWCGSVDCDDSIVKQIDMNMLGTPVKDEGFSGNCGLCGKSTEMVAYYAKTY
jgi:prolyl-tRNA synthetase